MKCWVALTAVCARAVRYYGPPTILSLIRSVDNDTRASVESLPDPFDVGNLAPSTMSEYCAHEKSVDPACDIDAPVVSLKDEVLAVYNHLKRFFKKKQEEQPKDAVDELEKLAKEEQRLEESLRTVKEVRTNLETKGEMDPELSQKVDDVIEVGERLHNIVRVMTDELLRSKNDDSWQRVAEMKNHTLRLVDAMNEAAGSIRAFSRDVHPSGSKWWRYRWEYGFFEAVTLVSVVFLFGLLDAVHHKIQKAVFGDPWFDVPSMFDFAASGTTMYKRWFTVFIGELAAMCIFQGLMAIVHRVGCFTLVAHFFQMPEVHLPDATHYRDAVGSVTHHLFLALVMYFLLVLTVVRSTEAKIQHWRAYEDGSHHWVHAGSGLFAQKSWVGVARDRHEYKALRQRFIMRVKTHAELVDKVEEHGPLDSMEFWRYLALTVRETAERLIKIDFLTWVGIILIFVLYAITFYVAQVGYMVIGCAQSVAFIMVLVAMRFAVSRIQHDVLSRQEDLAEWGAKTSYLDFCMAKIFQLVLFFLCYGAARTITTAEVTSLYPSVVIVMCVFACAFAFFFAYYICEVVTTFGTLIAIPPYAKADIALRLITHLEMEAAIRTDAAGKD
eukprot:GEMP01018032.1.p1 GENE.GEMP01018032.1~~GEMP01018032.1.p1  ORF type:complete len:611 (+),score=158.44 GEMP01018032.1:258-2090(+)